MHCLHELKSDSWEHLAVSHLHSGHEGLCSKNLKPDKPTATFVETLFA